MKIKKKHCQGCENTFYPNCWSLEDSKVVKRIIVTTNQMPPFKSKPRETLDCYHRKGYAYIDPKNINQKGFWERS